MTTTYLFPLVDSGNGPKTSIAIRSKGPSTGIGRMGASFLFLGFLRCAQGTQDRHQFTQL